jgi:hypothetical protein
MSSWAGVKRIFARASPLPFDSIEFHCVFEFERAVLRHRAQAFCRLNLSNSPFARSVKAATRVSKFDPKAPRFLQWFELSGVKPLWQLLVSLIEAGVPDFGFRFHAFDDADRIGLIPARLVIRPEYLGGGGQIRQKE